MKPRPVLTASVGLLLALMLATPSVLRAQAGAGGEVQLRMLLRGALRASRTQSLVGARVVEFRDGTGPPRHTELVTRTGQYLRIEFPADSPFKGQVIVDDGIQRRHYFPNRNEIRVLPSRKEEIIRQLNQLLGKAAAPHRFSEELATTVAGRPVRVITVDDLQGNVEQRLFLDKQNLFPLKRVLYDAVGTPIGSFEFTQVDYQATIDPALFVLERKGATVLTPRIIVVRLANRGGFEDWMVSPKSELHLEAARIENFDGVKVLVQIYDSPQGKISLFQVKSSVVPEKLQRSARSDFDVWVWKPHASTLILVGPRSGPSLQQIADLVQRGPSGT